MADNVFENIIAAANRSIDWGLNLILTPAELEVLVAEIERLRNDLVYIRAISAGALPALPCGRERWKDEADYIFCRNGSGDPGRAQDADAASIWD